MTSNNVNAILWLMLQFLYGVSMSQKRIVERMCKLIKRPVSILQEKCFSDNSDEGKWVTLKCYDYNDVCGVIRCKLVSVLDSISQRHTDSVQDPF